MSQAITYDSLDDLGLLYDHVDAYNERPDIAFYVEECARGAGNVLELACGTGRVLIPVARAGMNIVGVDRSARMLARCRDKVAAETPVVRERITLHAADMCDVNLGETFATVIIPFRPLQHLMTIDEQLACFDGVRRHLAPGGRLIFDVFNPDLGRIASPSTKEWEDTPETTLPDGRRFRRGGRLAAVHRLDQINDVELIYYLTRDGEATERRVHAFKMRWFLRQELEHLLARSGLAVEAFYGDFVRTPLADLSPEIVVVARAR
ncbi:MAG: class I SAM-dependent methyltransferase [bacterium]